MHSKYINSWQEAGASLFLESPDSPGNALGTRKAILQGSKNLRFDPTP